jgi:hypothetical protein
MNRSFAMVIFAFAAVAPCSALAQQTTAPEPILNVTLDPLRVVVGQPTTLRIDVLAPNYMTSPPELPGFQVRNAVTRQLQSVNLTEERNGMTYAGVRFEFALYPQEPGTYAVADQKVKVKYAVEPPAVREEALSLPRVSFAAFIPDAAAGLNPFLASSRLTIEQSVLRSSEQLKVGDSVTRSITIRAADTPAMLLPPVTFPAVEGLAVYPAQPALQDKTEGRTDAMTAARTDSATYILQQAGDYALPAMDVRWWNAEHGRIETAHLDAVTMHVADNSRAQATGAGTAAARSNWTAIVDLVADHWAAAILALVGLAALAWIIPRAGRAIANLNRQHRVSYLQSEQFYFDQLRRAARSGDAKASYFALLAWLQRFGLAGTIDTLKVTARDPALEQEVTSLETQLFASQPTGASWSPRRFIRHVGSARRSLRKKSVHQETHSALPPRLNPGSNRIPPRRQWRKPGR